MRSFESRKKSEGTSCSLCLRGTVGFRALLMSALLRVCFSLRDCMGPILLQKGAL